MHKEVKEYLRLRKKLVVLEYAHLFGNNLKAYKACGIPKSTFYEWKRAYIKNGEEGLKRKKPIAKRHPRALSQEVIDKILELRRVYHLGSRRIHWYLERYHGIETSESSVYRTLVRHNESRLP